MVESKNRFKVIPLSINIEYLGKLIKNENDCLFYLSKINTQRFIFSQDKIQISDFTFMFLYDKFIILNFEFGDTIRRSIYNNISGILVSEVLDRSVRDDFFIRKIANIRFTIFRYSIIKVESEKKLLSIKNKIVSFKDEPNPFIGS